MIPPSLSFIVSSDLRDPRGSESRQLCVWELILPKWFKIGTGLWWRMRVLCKRKSTGYTASDIFTTVYLLLFEYYFAWHWHWSTCDRNVFFFFFFSVNCLSFHAACVVLYFQECVDFSSVISLSEIVWSLKLLKVQLLLYLILTSNIVILHDCPQNSYWQ